MPPGEFRDEDAFARSLPFPLSFDTVFHSCVRRGVTAHRTEIDREISRESSPVRLRRDEIGGTDASHGERASAKACSLGAVFALGG